MGLTVHPKWGALGQSQLAPSHFPATCSCTAKLPYTDRRFKASLVCFCAQPPP